MLTVIANNENSRTISIPADEMKKLGFSNGDEIELSKENDEVVLRSTSEVERKRKFEEAKNNIFEEWNDVFIELAKGAGNDNKSIGKSIGPAGKFTLLKTADNKYVFNLIEADGQVIFQSAPYESQKEARDAIDSLKKLVTGEVHQIIDFPVEEGPAIS